MLDTISLCKNNTYEFRREFVVALLVLNALYWQQYDEDAVSESLSDDYATSLSLNNFDLFDFDLFDFDTIPHFQYLNNLQRINAWYDMYVRYITLGKVSDDSCLLDAMRFSLLAILMAAIEKELKFDTSINSKVYKFSRRIALYGFQILNFDYPQVNSPGGNVYFDFPLTFEEACSLIPLEYEVCTDQSIVREEYSRQAMRFGLPRQELIEQLRSMDSREYGNLLHENVLYSECNQDMVKNLWEKYGDEYSCTPLSIDDKKIGRWDELFNSFGLDLYFYFAATDCNDINSPLSAIESLVEQTNRELEEDNPGYHNTLSVNYFLIKDYVDSQLSLNREQVMLRLVQLVLYKLYAGKSFKFEDVEQLNEITTPLRSSLSVQSALTLAAYRCGVLIKRLQLVPCVYGLAAIDELFPNLDIFFQRGMDVG